MLSIGAVALLQTAVSLSMVDDHIRAEQDIIHYEIALSIPDRGSSIRASTAIRYVLSAASSELVLDFDSGFEIDSIILADGRAARREEWTWAPREGPGNLLVVTQAGDVGDTLSVTVHYGGSPQDGLIIRDNVHGRRTAFADNWPDRAHHWFPSEDHPSDKASVSFRIGVPRDWSAVANGRLMRTEQVGDGRTAWLWREDRPIPVHTMVIGAGIMSVAVLGETGGVPQTAWTFSEDSAFAVEHPFRRATDMVEVLIEVLGPFPYEKLAHVQSSTRYGGMENSSAIFYNESAYASRRMGESVVAHEIAHQWFGDAVSQYDWHHLWLSEGFASYFGPLYFQLAGEEETFAGAMRSDWNEYMNSEVVDRPVIDPAERNLFNLLNVNNYQKGAWVLHMLRGELGDSVFFSSVRDFYNTFRDSTALTDDLAAIVSRRAGRPMDWFFEQWLLRPGFPKVEVTWGFDAGDNSVWITVRQVQPQGWGVFSILLPIAVVDADGAIEQVSVRMEDRELTHHMEVRADPAELLIDPDETLLLQVVELERRR
ncbi:MAG: M1 family metallopeptidase [Gemmatimonadales bacterium]|jgi:aminopeptidase N